MRHRHLNHSRWTLAAVDDTIGRGRRADWRELREAADSDPDVRARIIRVCAAKVSDSRAQRHHLWYHYARTASA